MVDLLFWLVASPFPIASYISSDHRRVDNLTMDFTSTMSAQPFTKEVYILSLEKWKNIWILLF